MPDLYVDGSWVSALAGGHRTIVCPADGTVVGEVDEDVLAKILEPGVGEAEASRREERVAAALVGRRVVAVVNFPPKRIGPFVSEVLVLGAYNSAGEVILLAPDLDVEAGARIG